MKIVVLDGYTLNSGDLSWDALHALGNVRVYDRTPATDVVEFAADADILLTNKTPVSGEAILQLPNLKYIGVLATGYNIIDIATAQQQNIVVSNVPGYSTYSVAQLTFSLLLEITFHVQRHSDSARQGDWANSADFSFRNYPLTELAGKTMGIIGFGEIGQRVATIADAFGMNVIAHSRTQTDRSARANFKWATLSELLQQSDVVSLHCPLTETTKGMINSENLRQMKPNAILLNTSRGPLVIDDDLANALNNGIIAGAGIDVLSVEPPAADNPLLSAKNCLVTPHIAWATLEARKRLMDTVVSNVEAFINGQPANVVKV